MKNLRLIQQQREQIENLQTEKIELEEQLDGCIMNLKDVKLMHEASLEKKADEYKTKIREIEN